VIALTDQRYRAILAGLEVARTGRLLRTQSGVDGRGWSFERCSVIVSTHFEGETPWLHASIARDHMPAYADLVMLHRAVYPGFAYQVFAPPSSHVNIHPYALHLWGRADGEPAMPDFGRFGTI